MDLLALIRELQILEPLGHFALAGGSNLAIRFNHRKSVDIDLFTNRVIGIKVGRILKRRFARNSERQCSFVI